MKANIDIIKDFSDLQGQVHRLSRSNLELVNRAMDAEAELRKWKYAAGQLRIEVRHWLSQTEEGKSGDTASLVKALRSVENLLPKAEGESGENGVAN